MRHVIQSKWTLNLACATLDQGDAKHSRLCVGSFRLLFAILAGSIDIGRWCNGMPLVPWLEITMRCLHCMPYRVRCTCKQHCSAHQTTASTRTNLSGSICRECQREYREFVLMILNRRKNMQSIAKCRHHLQRVDWDIARARVHAQFGPIRLWLRWYFSFSIII